MKFEKKIVDFVTKYFGVFVVVGITIAAIIIRCNMINYESADFSLYLSRWYESLEMNGLRNTFMNGGIGDYNCPYVILLWVLTKIKLPALISIKIVSIMFDFGVALMAGLIVRKLLIFKKTKGHIRKYGFVITYSIVVLLPTVIINSALWAQCDAIYTFFVLASIICLLYKRNSLAFVMLGCAFAFKLQFIFVLPVYLLLYLKNKEFSLLNFLWIPIMLIVLSLPAILCGYSVPQIFNTYFLQVGEYKALTLNYPNIYQLFSGEYKYVSFVGYGLCVLLFAVLFCLVVRSPKKISASNLMTLFLFSVMVCVTFLPSMHERYAYMADVLGVIYLMAGGSAIIAILVESISLYGYFMSLFGNRVACGELLGLVPVGIVIYLGYSLKENFISIKSETGEKGILKI